MPSWVDAWDRARECSGPELDEKTGACVCLLSVAFGEPVECAGDGVVVPAGMPIEPTSSVTYESQV